MPFNILYLYQKHHVFKSKMKSGRTVYDLNTKFYRVYFSFQIFRD